MQPNKSKHAKNVLQKTIPTKNQTKSNVCKLCPHTITEKMRPGIGCYVCSKLFHGACVGLSSDDLTSLRRCGGNWACPSCRRTSRKSVILIPNTNDIPSVLNTSTEATSIANNVQLDSAGHSNTVLQNSSTPRQQQQQQISSEASIREILDRLISDVGKLMEFKTSAETSLSYYSSNFDDVQAITDKVASLTKKIEHLERENTNLKSFVGALEDRLAEIEQAQNDCHLVVSGLPEMEKTLNVSTQSLVADFSQTVGCSLDLAEIKFCKRLRLEKADTSQKPSTSNCAPKPSKILIGFHSTRIRDDYKQRVRNFKKNNKFVSFKNHSIDYYVSDQLTKHFSHLFYCAKTYAREHKFNYVWHSNSKIFLKKNFNSAVFTVKNFSDLKNLTGC